MSTKSGQVQLARQEAGISYEEDPATAKALADKMKNLQKENDLLRRQRDILKKVLGILSQRSRGIVISIYSDRGCQYASTAFRESLAQARLVLFDYIECFYNRSRLHSSLGYQSPVEYEQCYYGQFTLASVSANSG